MNGKTAGRKTICAILHDVRSVYNVGSVFRTADGAGISRLYLTGYTPSPVDRFGRARKDLAKVSLGAEKSVEWKSEKNIRKVISELKKTGFKIIAVEQSGVSVDFRKFKIPRQAVFVFGNETKGLSTKVLRLCDKAVQIPMFGEKESLNVSVVAGIILYSAT